MDKEIHIMENKHEIKQGAIYWLSMTRCGYNDKMRPYMVVSNNRHNSGAADVNIVPLTTSDKRLDLPCNVSVGCLVQVGKPCVARCSEITTVRRDRLTSDNWCGQADESTIRSVAEAISAQVAVAMQTNNKEAC